MEDIKTRQTKVGALGSYFYIYTSKFFMALLEIVTTVKNGYKELFVHKKDP